MGSDISIGCQSTLGCPSAQLLILLNYSLAEGTRLALPDGSVRLRLRDFRLPFATVTCFSLCARTGRDRLVCGTELRAGCECPRAPPALPSPGQPGLGPPGVAAPSPGLARADPPDPPGNLSCAIAEGSERLECGWDEGRVTHLHTWNSLHLSR